MPYQVALGVQERASVQFSHAPHHPGSLRKSKCISLGNTNCTLRPTGRTRQFYPSSSNHGSQRSIVEASKFDDGWIGERVEYKDGPTDIAFIALCRQAYGKLAGWQSERSWWSGHETYAAMVEVSRALMKGKTSKEQQDAVISGFPAVPAWFRKVFPYSKWGAEINAWITPTFFRWLVGPMERQVAEVDGIQQKSSVHIVRCRYLAESSCAGMCVNLCKTPVQTFFSQELGMPLTMKPNFEDYSCDMVFGERPPPREQDDTYTQPCLKDCTTAKASQQACFKLR